MDGSAGHTAPSPTTVSPHGHRDGGWRVPRRRCGGHMSYRVFFGLVAVWFSRAQGEVRSLFRHVLQRTCDKCSSDVFRRVSKVGQLLLRPLRLRLGVVVLFSERSLRARCQHVKKGNRNFRGKQVRLDEGSSRLDDGRVLCGSFIPIAECGELLLLRGVATGIEECWSIGRSQAAGQGEVRGA